MSNSLVTRKIAQELSSHSQSMSIVNSTLEYMIKVVRSLTSDVLDSTSNLGSDELYSLNENIKRGEFTAILDLFHKFEGDESSPLHMKNFLKFVMDLEKLRENFLTNLPAGALYQDKDVLKGAIILLLSDTNYEQEVVNILNDSSASVGHVIPNPPSCIKAFLTSFGGQWVELVKECMAIAFIEGSQFKKLDQKELMAALLGVCLQMLFGVIADATNFKMCMES
ncbi:hypothetical protein Misp06_02939 [Microbulbifer sp. NBRC 101763]|uniref:hypothetical protein n=1 Tax=Microbulbifer sp. NBRC 101763 TaxID=1113820 RepID=UPI0030B6F027